MIRSPLYPARLHFVLDAPDRRAQVLQAADALRLSVTVLTDGTFEVIVETPMQAYELGLRSTAALLKEPAL